MIVGDILAEKAETEIKIGVPRERTTITPEGRYKTRLEIPYMIGDANYAVLIDKEGATEESIEAAVRKDAKKIVGTTGKILKV